MTIKIPDTIPSPTDIDPETGVQYTKSKLKKLKKIISLKQRKLARKAQLLEEEKLKELEKTNELSRKILKGDFVEIVEDKTLPKASKIKSLNAKDFIGKRVVVNGWVDTLRSQGALIFILLRDNSDFKNRLQCVLSGKLSKTKDALELHREASVVLYGTLSKDDRAEGSVELQVDYWKVVGKSTGEYSNIVDDDTNVSISMDQRHLFLRKKTMRLIFQLRSNIINILREKLFKSEFTEVTPPCLVQTQVEGGSTLFKVDYFGKEANLTQSSQLYLETCIFSLGNVFCISPSFRAEKTRTRRHVTEYTHLEVELGFITYEELMESLETLFVEACEAIVERHGSLLKEINPEFKVPTLPFKRMDHSEAIKFCRENNIYKNEETKEHFKDGEDIPEGPERKMTEIIGRPTFLCRFPAEMKPFYMKKCLENRKLTESFDLLIPGVGEVVGGSMREDDYDTLISGFKNKGIDAANYYWYTDLRKYGSIPHGGYGMGIERMLCWILGRDHIRDVCLYPRFTNRCSP